MEGVGEHQPGVHVLSRHARVALPLRGVGKGLDLALGDIARGQRGARQAQRHQRDGGLPFNLALRTDNALSAAAGKDCRARGALRAADHVGKVFAVIRAGKQQRQVGGSRGALGAGRPWIARSSASSQLPLLVIAAAVMPILLPPAYAGSKIAPDVATQDISKADYEVMAEYRYAMRRFLTLQRGRRA